MNKNSKYRLISKNPENQNFHLDLKPDELENSDFEFGFRIENGTRSKFRIFDKKFRFQNFKKFEFQNSDFEFGFRIKFYPRSNFGQNFDFKNFDFKISISKFRFQNYFFQNQNILFQKQNIFF